MLSINFIKLLLLLLIIIDMVDSTEWKLIEKLNVNNQRDYTKQDRINPNEELKLIFFIKQNSVEDIANDISNPHSVNYGKHLTKAQVDELTANPEATKEIKSYFEINNINIKEITNNGAYITAIGLASDWEKLLNTHFHYYVNSSGDKLARTHKYYLPDNLAGYVTGIMNTVQFPLVMSPGPVIRSHIPRTGY
mmetsp:Transcript_15846/g.14338  ORF Transcript_15846/g.14338 Transcript_15846/m.14338 type:complete len:193 (+) Transcript_15846:20-598(+)